MSNELIMKNLDQIKKFLLPSHFRKRGYVLLITGLPLVLLIMSVLVLNKNNEAAMDYWSEWNGYLLHIPIAIGLFWILFASEDEEDEMFLSLRLKATFHAIRFIFIWILFLPVISMISTFGFGNELKKIDVGGNLAVVSLLLLYANISYWYLKKKALQDEE